MHISLIRAIGRFFFFLMSQHYRPTAIALYCRWTREIFYTFLQKTPNGHKPGLSIDDDTNGISIDENASVFSMDEDSMDVHEETAKTNTITITLGCEA